MESGEERRVISHDIKHIVQPATSQDSEVEVFVWANLTMAEICDFDVRIHDSITTNCLGIEICPRRIN